MFTDRREKEVWQHTQWLTTEPDKSCTVAFEQQTQGRAVDSRKMGVNGRDQRFSRDNKLIFSPLRYLKRRDKNEEIYMVRLASFNPAHYRRS